MQTGNSCVGVSFLLIIWRNFYKHLFWKTAASENVFMKLRKIKKLFIRSFSFTLKKTGFFNITIRNKWKYLFLFHDCFPVHAVFVYILLLSHAIFPWCGEKNSNDKYLLELIKRKPKVQEKNMSCECVLNFDQWKTFSENYKPMRD